MGGKKINNFIEIGPGKVLTGLVKRILPNSKSFNINSIDDIKNLNNES
jgi:[acyl-carrier-protein] S-malonyltransferase